MRLGLGLGVTALISLRAPVPAPLPTVTLSADVAKAEGNSGANLFTFTVTLSAPAGSAINVPWSFSAGTTSADDFTGGTLPTGGTVAIAQGASSGTFSLSVNGDVTVESDEQFSVAITAPSGYTAGAKMSATGTIQNDDISAGNGFATSNARSSNTGEYMLLDVAGGTWNAAEGLLVDPTKVTILADMPSVTATGAATTVRTPIAAGLRADLIAGSPNVLRVWLEDVIYVQHANITVTLAEGAIKSGSDITAGVASLAVTNNNVLFDTPLPPAHIVGIPTGRRSITVMHGVVRGQWRAEVAGIHYGGLAGVEWTIQKTGQAAVTIWQAQERRSWFQDDAVMSDAQFDANAAGGLEGGLGVWPSPVGDAATDPTGPVVITAVIVPRLGGRPRARTLTWTIYSAQAGAYPERVIYLNPNAADDNGDGLTPSTAKKLMASACNLAGAAANGATQQTVPVVAIMGGTSANPLDIEYAPPTAGSGSAIPSATDTYLIFRMAPGYGRDSIRLVNFAGPSSGTGSRVRRTMFDGITVDIADSLTGSSSKGVFGLNSSVYPKPTNPQALWFHNCVWTHRQGKIGQLTEGNNGFVISSTWGKENPVFFTNWTHTNTGQRGIQSNGFTVLRNIRVTAIQKDVFKAPECVFGFYSEDNAVDPRLLPIGSVTGTPTAGDTITGVYSWPAQETVEAYIGGVIKLTAGGNSYSFKPDDSKTHVALTITGETGTIQVGETIRNSANTATFKVYRRDGSILRGSYTSGSFSTSQVLTGNSSGATATASAIANNQVSLFFSPSGTRAAAAPPHPDGLQIQNFYPVRYNVTNIVGTFQVGEAITVPGITGAMTLATVGADYLEVTGTALPESRTADTIAGSTSGATATIVLAYSIQNDTNLLLCNGIFRRTDGQILFGENGAASVGLYNILGLRLDIDSPLNSSMGNVSGMVLAHCSLPTQNWRYAGAKVLPGTPRPGNTVIHNIFASMSADYVAPGQSLADDKGKAGWRVRNHLTRSAAVAATIYSTRLADIYTTEGDPGFSNGLTYGEPDNSAATVAKNNFRPTAAVPANTAVTTVNRLVRYDLAGNDRAASDWPGAYAKAA